MRGGMLLVMGETVDDFAHAALKDATAAGRAETWLRAAGLRPTRQRRALAALLIGDGANRHVTADALHCAARDAGESVSLATVYNTLKCFTEVGLLNEISVDGARSYFDTRTDSHTHFYWEDEGALDDAAPEGVEVVNLPEPPAGAEISRVDVVIRLRRKTPRA